MVPLVIPRKATIQFVIRHSTSDLICIPSLPTRWRPLIDIATPRYSIEGDKKYFVPPGT